MIVRPISISSHTRGNRPCKAEDQSYDLNAQQRLPTRLL